MKYIAPLLILLSFSCTEKNSSPNFVFKEKRSDEVLAKISDYEIKATEFYKGIEADIFEHEQQIYELKMKRLNSLILKHLIEKEEESKTMGLDEFMNRVIAKGVKVSEQDFQEFVKQKSIPLEHMTDQMKGKIEEFLLMEKKREATQTWIAKKTKSAPVEVFFKKPTRPIYPVEALNAPFIGAKNAPITIVEFSDFQCPFSARGSAVIKSLLKKYPKKVKLAFKHFPLPFHQQAKLASIASICAFNQNETYFEKFYDFFFSSQEKISKEEIIKLAKSMKIDEPLFTACLDDEKIKEIVELDFSYGQGLGVKATPTYFVNGRLINGALSIDVFSELIEEILQEEEYSSVK